MGLLSDLRALVSGGGPASAELERMELEQVRAMGEAAERQAGGDGPLGPKVRRRYRFAGSVQGVGFRWTTTNLANSVGATGWVLNEPDGTVTAEIQGIREQVDAVIEGLDRYYNGRRWMAGFRIEEARDVEVISGELDFRPIY
jgi:acylphosphatase